MKDPNLTEIDVLDKMITKDEGYNEPPITLNPAEKGFAGVNSITIQPVLAQNFFNELEDQKKKLMEPLNLEKYTVSRPEKIEYPKFTHVAEKPFEATMLVSIPVLRHLSAICKKPYEYAIDEKDIVSAFNYSTK